MKAVTWYLHLAEASEGPRHQHKGHGDRGGRRTETKEIPVVPPKKSLFSTEQIKENELGVQSQLSDPLRIEAVTLL